METLDDKVVCEILYRRGSRDAWCNTPWKSVKCSKTIHNMSWWLDRLTTRLLPIAEPYQPKYTGQGFTVWLPADTDTHRVKQISSDSDIKYYTDISEVEEHIDDFSAVVITDPKIVNELDPDIMDATHTLVIIPSGDADRDISDVFTCDLTKYIVVGSHNDLDHVNLTGNWGNIDIYAGGNTSTEAAISVAAASAQYWQCGQSDNTRELRNHIITGASQDLIGGVFFPYDMKLEYWHGKHHNNRILTVPSKHDPKYWNMPTDFGLRFFLNLYNPKTLKLNVSPEVVSIRTDMDMPEFVTLNDDFTITIDNHYQDLQTGIYEFVLVAQGPEFAESIALQAIIMHSDKPDDIDYNVKYVRHGDRYVALETVSTSPFME